MATHSSILAWEIPWTRGACWGTVSPWGWKRVGLNLVTKQQPEKARACSPVPEPLPVGVAQDSLHSSSTCYNTCV